MLLDEILPAYDVHEVHRVPLSVTPERALAMARAVTPREVPVVRGLFRLRGLGPRLGATVPLFDQMLATGFRVLAEDDHEIVLGLVGRPWRPRGGLRPDADFATFAEPGFARMAMNFRADGRELVTETRVAFTDAAARRRFKPYWLVIRPFSGLIRRSWLRAARRRLVGARSG